jgi:hypothetical protein
MLIVDDIINLIDVVVSERNLELSLDLHAVDCSQGLYWNRLFVGWSAGNVLLKVRIYIEHINRVLFFLLWLQMSKLFQCCTYATKTLVLLRKIGLSTGLAA